LETNLDRLPIFETVVKFMIKQSINNKLTLKRF